MKKHIENLHLFCAENEVELTVAPGVLIAVVEGERFTRTYEPSASEEIERVMVDALIDDIKLHFKYGKRIDY